MSIKFNSFSNLLIALSVIATLLYWSNPEVGIFGMNALFFLEKSYGNLILQFSLYQFFHGDIFHILFNGYALYIYGNQAELLMGQKKYMTFFLLNTVFVGFAVIFLSTGNTIGISGFVMSILSYIYLELRTLRHPGAQSVGFFLFLNIAIGLLGNISFVGHFFGALFGMIFYMVTKKIR